jgi:hypothetical protein
MRRDDELGLRLIDEQEPANLVVFDGGRGSGRFTLDNVWCRAAVGGMVGYTVFSLAVDVANLSLMKFFEVIGNNNPLFLAQLAKESINLTPAKFVVTGISAFYAAGFPKTMQALSDEAGDFFKHGIFKRD